MKRENKNKKLDVTVISFVREKSYAGRPRIYTLSADGALTRACRTRIANDVLRGWRRLIGTCQGEKLRQLWLFISPVFMLDLRDLRAVASRSQWEVPAICMSERKTTRQGKEFASRRTRDNAEYHGLVEGLQI